MKPAQVELVQKTFADGAPIAEEAAAMLDDRLLRQGGSRGIGMAE